MSHEQKYLKYKEKYLQLKYILLGGSINDWMRKTDKGWEEVHLVDKRDIPAIDATIKSITSQKLPSPIVRQQKIKVQDLPSKRKLVIYYTDYEEGFRIDKLEYNGLSGKSELKKGLDKLFDFIQFAIGNIKGSGYFKDKIEAINDISSNYNRIIGFFTTYKNKPTLAEIIVYINSHPNIQNIQA
jgi:hypothetical protein